MSSKKEKKLKKLEEIIIPKNLESGNLNETCDLPNIDESGGTASNIFDINVNRRQKYEESRHKLDIEHKKNKVSSYLETHRSLCDEISTAVDSLNVLVSKMAMLERKLNDSEYRTLFLSKKLNVNIMLGDLKVASSRLDKNRKLSSMFNSIRRDDIMKDIEEFDREKSKFY